MTLLNKDNQVRVFYVDHDLVSESALTEAINDSFANKDRNTYGSYYYIQTQITSSPELCESDKGTLYLEEKPNGLFVCHYSLADLEGIFHNFEKLLAEGHRFYEMSSIPKSYIIDIAEDLGVYNSLNLVNKLIEDKLVAILSNHMTGEEFRAISFNKETVLIHLDLFTNSNFSIELYSNSKSSLPSTLGIKGFLKHFDDVKYAMIKDRYETEGVSYSMYSKNSDLNLYSDFDNRDLSVTTFIAKDLVTSESYKTNLPFTAEECNSMLDSLKSLTDHLNQELKETQYNWSSDEFSTTISTDPLA